MSEVFEMSGGVWAGPESAPVAPCVPDQAAQSVGGKTAAPNGAEILSDGAITFAFRAMSVSMKAKCGKRITLADQIDLAEMCAGFLPDDEAALAAVARFIGRVRLDPVAAGVALGGFLAANFAPVGGDYAARVSKALDQIAQDEPLIHEWQKRRDCGME